jgi:prepilin-type N-terminal cleavage/methylation domain-containing protein
MSACVRDLTGANCRRQRGMTLIEMVGALAIVAILAALILPALIKQTDKAVADQEAAVLQSFSDGLQRRILRYGYIPGPLDWTTNIATEFGIAPSDVAANSRHNPRYLIFDPAFTNSLSFYYTNTSAGVSRAPVGARMMILSSLGRPLTNLATGMLPAAGDFAIIWNTVDGTVPSAAAFSNWRGTGEDLKVQRINLAPLFARLVLSYYASTNRAGYSVGAGVTNPVTSLVGLDAYFLKNSQLNLYAGPAAALDSQLILNSDMSYWYYQDAWRGFMPGTTGVPGAPTNTPGAFDFSAIVNGFLNATPTSLGAGQQRLIIQDFINYMNAYTAWATSNFSDQAPYNQAVGYQLNMMSHVQALVNAIQPQ